jgi:transglutaminase-like putative cysteine protease
MGHDDTATGIDASRRVVTCDLAFTVVEPAEIVFQVTASRSAGKVVDEQFELLTEGRQPLSVTELHDPHATRLHVVDSAAGRLTLSYRAEIAAPEASGRDGPGEGLGGVASSLSDYERHVYLRPSRYCPSDHLVGFAVAEFGAGPGAGERVAAIGAWIRGRIGYVPGSSSVHDTAEDTLLTGVGTCRDFAHLGIALCRATGVPARFAAVYAPGLYPMDFHAVFEAFEGGCWSVHDATGLAPRQSMVRVVTGRDAADTAFATITGGIADLEAIEVTATVGGDLPFDDHADRVELA